MKNKVSIFVAFLILPTITAFSNNEKNIEFESEAIVISKSGLILRSGPDKTSKKILTIPHNDRLKVVSPYTDALDTNSIGKVDNINNISANWRLVQYKDTVGWVFGGYLELPEELYSDLMKYYKLNGPIKTINNFKKRFNILLKVKNKESIGTLSNVGNPIAEKVYAIYEAGFGTTKLYKIDEDSKNLIFYIFHDQCTEFSEPEEGETGDCIEIKIHCYKYKMSFDLFEQLIKGRFRNYELTGFPIEGKYCVK